MTYDRSPSSKVDAKGEYRSSSVVQLSARTLTDGLNPLTGRGAKPAGYGNAYGAETEGKTTRTFYENKMP